MGLGTKIKNALSPEHTHGGSYEKDRVPGSYPEETPTKSTGGSHIAPHGTALNDGAGVTGPSSSLDRYENGTDRKGVSFSEDQSGLPSTHRSKAIAGKDSDPYLGSTTDGNNHRSNLNDMEYDKMGSGLGHNEYDQYKNNKHSSKHAHHDSGIDIGLAERPTNSGNKLRKDQYRDDTEFGNSGRRHHDTTETTGLGTTTAGMDGLGHRDHITHAGTHSPHSSGPAVGGGVYNTVTGTGSPEDSKLGLTGTRSGSPGSAGLAGSNTTQGANPLSTSTSTGLTTNPSYDPGLATRDIAPTSRDHRMGPGLAGAGAGAGAAAALAHRHHQDERQEIYDTHRGTGNSLGHTDFHDPSSTSHALGRDPGHHLGGKHNTSGFTDSSQRQYGDGVPRSNLLDPEPAASTANAGLTSGTRGVDDATRHSGGFGATDLSQNRHHGIGAGHSSGLGSSINPAAAATSASAGRDHYGPGHVGAKVMHKCHNCGMDNDISNYFKSDTVYRIG